MAKTIGQLNPATTIANDTLFVIEKSSQTFKVAASVVRGGLVNADIDAAAAIVYSKLDLDDSIVAGDLTADAVTTAKIDDDAVTTAKIDDDAVTTAKILDANVTPAKLSQPYTLATAKAFNWNGSSSNAVIDFESIPSWAKRITVMLNGVSANGSSLPLIQVGSGSIETSGYSSGTRDTTTTTAGSGGGSSQGLILASTGAGNVLSGHIVLTLVSSNTWCGSHNIYLTVGGNHYSLVGAGTSPALSGTLDRIRITTVNGTDTFDAGTINISYEG